MALFLHWANEFFIYLFFFRRMKKCYIDVTFFCLCTFSSGRKLRLSVKRAILETVSN